MGDYFRVCLMVASCYRMAILTILSMKGYLIHRRGVLLATGQRRKVVPEDSANPISRVGDTLGAKWFSILDL